MRWLKRDKWEAGIALAGLLLFVIFMVWIPASSVRASERTSEPSMAGTPTVQPKPTVDLTVTALQKEQLTLQVQQLQNQLQDHNNWLANNSTALIAAIIGFTQWAGNRRDERRKELVAQDKDLRAQAEERFKSAVTALGSENEATQVGGAILLRSFLNKDDEKIYGRYYTQIFDLAVAYLRLSSKSQTPHDPDISLPLTPLRQALIVVFKEAFPLARDERKRSSTPFNPRLLDASYIQLDNAYLEHADLREAWMPSALLRVADLGDANLNEANLNYTNLSGIGGQGANLSKAQFKQVQLDSTFLPKANFSEADLREADLSCAELEGADLSGVKLNEANLSGVNLRAADLSGADLREADLEEANLEETQSPKDTDLRGAKGLTKEQLEACKAKGAIVDEDATVDSSPSNIASPPPSQSTDAQATSASPAQVNTPLPSSDRSSSASSQPSAQP